MIVLLVELANGREGNIPAANFRKLRDEAQEALVGVEAVTGKLSLPRYYIAVPQGSRDNRHPAGIGPVPWVRRWSCPTFAASFEFWTVRRGYRNSVLS